MLPASLSETLVKTMGVGIALADAGDRAILFRNPSFESWFPEAGLGSRIDAVLDAGALDEALEGRVLEIQTRPKRRTLVIEIRAYRADHHGREIIVLEAQNISRLRETEALIDSYSRMADRRARDLEREKTQVEKLLLNVMPRAVYEEYKAFGTVTPRLYEPVSVLMLDFVGFTEMAVSRDPTLTVTELNDLFTAFDRIAELHGCERIKTVGDCYMAVAGLPNPTPDHARNAGLCAAKMLRYLNHRNEMHPTRWRARIGIASGAVVGSVVGINKYVYDVFGPAVNRAARLQALSNPMEISICTEMVNDLGDEFQIDRVRSETLRGFGTTTVAALTERDSRSLAA